MLNILIEQKHEDMEASSLIFFNRNHRQKNKCKAPFTGIEYTQTAADKRLCP
jgi:hypothetical protein